jgi:diguanylate cyclase (GGDEF)-like protein
VGLTATGLAGPAPWQTTVVFVGPSSGASRAFTTAAAVQADGREIAAGLAPELGDRLPAETCLWQPVMQHGSAVGVLAFYWSERGALARSSVQTVIDLLMAEAAVTLQRIELLDRLGAIARTDDLTGLPNRRAWNEDLTREIARAQREQAPLCVAILDLDHFKAFNDTHGHQAGDLLLKQAAARWNAELRATDLLARYGGEEFALALPGVSPETAEEIIDRLRRATPQDESCSAGAVWWDGAESPSELLGRADAALYAAKGAGRARTVFA